MDFARVIQIVSDFLTERGHPFAVIGGVAMAAYGVMRTTLDLDLVTSKEAQPDFVEFLELQGYTTIHRSSGYSNHIHDDRQKGRVDVVYVGGSTREALFSSVRMVSGPGERPIPVLRPEHLAAMKVFAMKNDATRTLAELEDIRFLLSLEGVDRDEVRGYFEKHDLAQFYEQLE